MGGSGANWRQEASEEVDSVPSERGGRLNADDRWNGDGLSGNLKFYFSNKGEENKNWLTWRWRISSLFLTGTSVWLTSTFAKAEKFSVHLLWRGRG